MSIYDDDSVNESFRAEEFVNTLRESLMSHLQSCVRRFLDSTFVWEIEATRIYIMLLLVPSFKFTIGFRENFRMDHIEEKH